MNRTTNKSTTTKKKKHIQAKSKTYQHKQRDRVKGRSVTFQTLILYRRGEGKERGMEVSLQGEEKDEEEEEGGGEGDRCMMRLRKGKGRREMMGSSDL